ncbi:MAG: energy transducer TonB [Rhodothermales bacterium]|nr:energy transducer TonB [Rhodothermales bacterium]MBO6778736.1 energy transducer TonB [Rhodothermales bacterium]
MRRNFLKGNFLPAYGQSLGRLRTPPPESGDIPAEQLKRSFQQRAFRYRVRRDSYLSGFQAGLIASLLLVVGAFNLRVDLDRAPDYVLESTDLVQFEEILQTTHFEKPPPPPRPPVPVEVPNDDLLEDIELDLDMTLDLDEAITTLPPPPPAPVVEAAPEPDVFVVVEQMPEMIGGLAALLSDLAYPELARKAGLEGIVVVQIIIDEQGNPSQPTVMKSVHKLLDEEAVRAVMKQRYTPGKQRGRAVKVSMNIPVTFRLN